MPITVTPSATAVTLFDATSAVKTPAAVLTTATSPVK